MNTDTDRPDEQWSLPRLGEFCSWGHKKLAVHAWRFGHALNLAREKQKQGEWQTWKQQYVPGLGHSSEHRYRTLARSLTEESLEGMGLTEAYRLLELTGAPEKGKKRGDPFVQAPQAEVIGGGRVPPTRGGAVATGADDPDEDDPDAADDLAELPPPACFVGLPPATGLMDSAEDDTCHRVACGPMEVEAEPEVVIFDPETVGERSPGERYGTLLRDAQTHLEALQSWADWLKQRDEVFLVEMSYTHGVNGVAAQIKRTVEGLRWVAENLEW